MDTTVTQQEARAHSLDRRWASRPQQVKDPSEPAPYRPGSYGLYTKRVFDIVISLVLMISVLSWAFPLLCAIILLSSKGPAIFIQRRVGYRGRIFKCFKFRTMYVNEYADTLEAAIWDERITPVGRWLRKTGIDELPQLVNVLLGDMSIIGPRPHMLWHHTTFSATMPHYDERLNVRPGITGLAQVKGFHGTISDHFSIHGRTKLDRFYARKSSFSLDIFILYRTIPIIFPLKKSGL